jgi:hypothetical protein
MQPRKRLQGPRWWNWVPVPPSSWLTKDKVRILYYPFKVISLESRAHGLSQLNPDRDSMAYSLIESIYEKVGTPEGVFTDDLLLRKPGVLFGLMREKRLCEYLLRPNPLHL